MPGIISLLRLVGAALLSAVCYYFIPNREGYWVVIAALLSVQIIDAGLWQKRVGILLITGLVSAGLACASIALSFNPFLLAAFLFITTLISIYIGGAWSILWGALFLVNIFALISPGLMTDWQGTQARGLFILLGFGIAILMQLFFFPTRLVPSLKKQLAECLLDIAKLNQQLFTCYLSRDYAERFYFYEKIFHEQRKDVLYSLHEARIYIKQLPHDSQYAFILNDIEHVYEIVLSLGSLLWRVSDPSTFEVIQAEFLSLSTNINKKIRYITTNLQGRTQEDDASLTYSIEELEDVQRSALQIVAKEPLAFLLFIHDLKELDALLTQLGQAVTTETANVPIERSGS